MPAVYLICNAHIDPIWQWEWDEGLAAALATFRAAADLCEEVDGFVFNHNEALLYAWIEEYEPALFARIRRLVAAGRWHIMGGWFLQPDCNMPAGESLVRQIRAGRRYFRERFGAAPTTAINFDPFGHSRGLVQILARCGFDSYLFCRPDPAWLDLPGADFVWVGHDGSRVLAHRSDEFYNSPLGGARAKVEAWLREHPAADPGLILWGVGNHGGGPSRRDLRDLAALMAARPEAGLRHATPEDYFRDLRERAAPLPEYAGDLNPWAVGCYTSMASVKQGHRRLEDTLYPVERMAACASLQGLLPHPEAELREAERDLLLTEFHDVLPGSSVPAVEAAALRAIGHGLEILERIRVRTFFALTAGQPPAAEGEIPILVFNPHPFALRVPVACEFQLADQNWGETWTVPDVRGPGGAQPAQVEHEASNLSLDWRKRVVFEADLAPMAMSRFDCVPRAIPRRAAADPGGDGPIELATPDLRVRIGRGSGLIEAYEVGGVPYLLPGACAVLLLADDADPWGMRVRAFRREVGRFVLMSPERAARFCGAAAAAPVRVIEDGPVRTVVEAYFARGESTLHLTYLLPRRGAEIEVRLRVAWQERDAMLKLSLPTPLVGGRYLGQTAYGRAELPADGSEAVSQRWAAIVSADGARALTVINDGVYGSDCAGGELRPSLLRAPGYAAHPILDRPLLPPDRFSPRVDEGVRQFRFWLAGGAAAERLGRIDREAQARAEPPQALSLFPSGDGSPPLPLVVLEGEAVQLTACTLAADGRRLLLRLFEPSGVGREATLHIPPLDLRHTVRFAPFEIRTLALDAAARRIEDAPLDA